MNYTYNANTYQKQKEQRARKKQEHAYAAKVLKQYLIDLNIWNDIPLLCQKFLEDMSTLSRQFIQSRTAVLLFVTLKPGSSVTLKNAITKTGKGLAAINKIMADLRNRGYKINFIEDEQDIMNSHFVIESCPED